MPDGHPPVNQKDSQKMACPFASMAKEKPTEQQPFQEISPKNHRPDSLPTPPDTREHYIDNVEGEANEKESILSPPSVAGSFSKCPIRMLDEKPPEEIAEYFETHKHEIPRSHEICVKRYQSNEQSIRLLDAKYGNLVNMIQGLGLKHQPLLHDKDEGDVDEKAGSKVDKWVDKVRPPLGDAQAVDDKDDGSVALDDREGHFERPLREIRVGESPSRPWGISVPVGPPHLEEDLSGKKGSNPIPEPKPAHSSKYMNRTSTKLSSDSFRNNPNMVFNGPVFIGYPAEQAAAFLKQSGMST